MYNEEACGGPGTNTCASAAAITPASNTRNYRKLPAPGPCPGPYCNRGTCRQDAAIDQHPVLSSPGLPGMINLHRYLKKCLYSRWRTYLTMCLRSRCHFDCDFLFLYFVTLLSIMFRILLVTWLILSKCLYYIKYLFLPQRFLQCLRAQVDMAMDTTVQHHTLVLTHTL